MADGKMYNVGEGEGRCDTENMDVGRKLLMYSIISGSDELICRNPCEAHTGTRFCSVWLIKVPVR